MVREAYIHHAISISALIGGMIIGRWIGTIVSAMMLTELSTIFLDIRAIMRELKIDQKHERCFIINGLLLVFSFFITRVFFLSWLTFFKVIPWLFKYDWNELRDDYGVLI